MHRLLLIFFMCFLAFDVFAFIEMGGNFSYKRQVYGSARENKHVSRTYSGSMAWYLYRETAIEFNYSRGENTITENVRTELGTDLFITSVQNKIITQTYGVGIRQALAPLKSFLVPTISLGYARRYIVGGTDYNFEDAGVARMIHLEDAKTKIDSIFGTFTLKFNVTQLFALTGSVTTVFKAVEWNEAKDNLQYLAGFSWIF